MQSVGACIALGAAAFAGAGARAQCTGDIDGSGVVEANDLASLLGAWGAATGKSAAADFDANGVIDAADLGQLLANWGVCVSVPEWATLLEATPSAAAVPNGAMREAIVATGLAWRVRHTATGIEMLLVPPGSFNMGCSGTPLYACYSSETPVHAVTLTNPFYLGRHEVTQAQWTAVMGSNPSMFQGASVPNAAVRPVERVSWSMIQPFLSATGMRLPTEAEWEYAYRAGTTTAFHSMPAAPNGTSNESLVGGIAWYAQNAGNPAMPTYGTNPVGTKSANALGLHDMSGNVAEWVADFYAANYYASSPPTNPPGPATGTTRVLRGGSWFDHPGFLRSSGRLGVAPGLVLEYHGFRVARQP